jgi:hypothetical protein
MEPPLTPLEFSRRTRKLYPERKAVVDGDLRLNSLPRQIKRAAVLIYRLTR